MAATATDYRTLLSDLAGACRETIGSAAIRLDADGDPEDAATQRNLEELGRVLSELITRRPDGCTITEHIERISAVFGPARNWGYTDTLGIALSRLYLARLA
jgi:hypothetical protein